MCGCCEDCDCDAESYRATLTLPARPPGDLRVRVEGEDYTIGVTREETCQRVLAETVELPLDPVVREAGPSATWVRATARELRCCFDPKPLLVSVPPGPGSGASHAFELWDCERDCGCDCGPDGRRCTSYRIRGRLPGARPGHRRDRGRRHVVDGAVANAVPCVRHAHAATFQWVRVLHPSCRVAGAMVERALPMRRGAAALSVALMVLGCAEGTGRRTPGPIDASPPPIDASVPPIDAGRDAPPPVDAGTDARPPMDARPMDTGARDTGTPDTGAPDTGAPDTGTPDAGPRDTGTPDTGAPDTGAPDTGTMCGVGLTPCPEGGGAVCVDLMTNDEHCGSCANACPMDARCTAGACQPDPVEICDNGRDDDGDGAIDCADPDCAADAACVVGLCDGLVSLSDASGAISDGSGTDNYERNMDCSWRITVAGAMAIQLDFTELVTESGRDVVSVYQGTSTAGTLLGRFSGASLPPRLFATGDSLFVRFTTDGSVQGPGFAATYTSRTTPLESCGNGVDDDGDGATGLRRRGLRLGRGLHPRPVQRHRGPLRPDRRHPGRLGGQQLPEPHELRLAHPGPRIGLHPARHPQS